MISLKIFFILDATKLTRWNITVMAIGLVSWAVSVCLLIIWALLTRPSYKKMKYTENTYSLRTSYGQLFYLNF